MTMPKKLSNTLYPVALAFVAVGAVVILYELFLAPVFAGEIILQQTLRLGPLTLRYYGLILALGALAGWFIAMKRAPEYGVDREQAEWIILLCVLAGLLGARLYHVLTSWQFYLHNPKLIFAFWNGGLGIYGALIGGAIALAIVVRQQGWTWTKYLNYLNWLTFSFLAGQIIGRFGNLFNYEAFGSPTNLPWKMFVPIFFRPAQYVTSAFFHPWFLYESLANLVIFFVLLRWKRHSLDLFLWYVLLYNIARLMLEFLRADSTFIGVLRLNFVVSTVLAALALAAIIKLRNRKSELPQSS